MLHIHVFLAAPLGSGYMTQPGTDQHQCRISIREGTDYSCPAPDLPVHPLDDIVGPDLHPMLRGEVTVGQRFLNAIRYFLRSLRAASWPSVRQSLRRPLPGCFLALLGVDCFEHLRHIFDFGFGHNREYVSVEMHHTALVLGPGKHLSHSL